MIRSICLHVLRICRSYYGKKNAKEISALVASCKSYDDFTDFRPNRWCLLKKNQISKFLSEILSIVGDITPQQRLIPVESCAIDVTDLAHIFTVGMPN